MDGSLDSEHVRRVNENGERLGAGDLQGPMHENGGGRWLEQMRTRNVALRRPLCI